MITIEEIKKELNDREEKTQNKFIEVFRKRISDLVSSNIHIHFPVLHSAHICATPEGRIVQQMKCPITITKENFREDWECFVRNKGVWIHIHDIILEDMNLDELLNKAVDTLADGAARCSFRDNVNEDKVKFYSCFDFDKLLFVANW